MKGTDYYAILGPGRSVHNSAASWWPKPKYYIGRWPQPGDWLEHEGGIQVYGRHQLTDIDASEIWECEIDNKTIIRHTNTLVRRARLLRRLDTWTERTARLFACDCAERVVHLLGPDKRCAHVIAVAREYANGNATASELDDALEEGWSAASHTATEVVWDDAWKAVSFVASETGWGAALDAPSAAAKAIGEKAALEAVSRTGHDYIADSAYSAAQSAEIAWQDERLFEYLYPCPASTPTGGDR